MTGIQGIDPATKRERVLHLAQYEGIKAGALCGALGTAAVAAATKFSPWFRRSTSVSAKTALAVSPFFLVYILRTELVMHRANLDPASFGITNDSGSVPAIAKVTAGKDLSLPQKTANWLYLNPFKMIAGMGVPAVAGILYSMRKEGHLKLSQKLMHTRVYGQMTVVTMLVTTMMFRETMRRNGGVFVGASEREREEIDEIN